MNEFLKTYIRARRIAKWDEPKTYELNFLKEKHLYEDMVIISPNYIKYIENPSEQVQLVAVQEDGHSIQYIQNPSEQAQLAAVNQNGNSIQFIQNPSEQVQLAAVQEDGYSIKYIENPTDKVKQLFTKLKYT